MKSYTPNETEHQFILAFTSVKESLIEEVVKQNQPFDKATWHAYHELDALISRLYAGEEEIIYT